MVLAFGQGPESIRKEIIWSMLYEDTSLPLTVFLMLINPEAYEQKKEKDFKFWFGSGLKLGMDSTINDSSQR